MSNNSKKIKKMFEREFDIEIMKQSVFSKQKEKRMKLKMVSKWSVVSISLITIISCVSFGGNKGIKTNIEQKNNVSIYINDISDNLQGVMSDADVKIINGINIPYFQELSGIVVPEDFDNKDNADAIYVKSDKNSNEYDALQCYVFNYFNTKNQRNIRIALSKENKPIRDYYFLGGNISKINGVKLKIFKSNDLFFTEFNYNNINFDIETTGITEKELTDLLKSIIK